ncbi:MAG: SUF system Fe-S cluster assembly regulator [Mariprofundaceae bacterium]|nr:SUF system Fe-S cluster assembly regulator [Mariprofundaceae bacterium]
MLRITKLADYGVMLMSYMADKEHRLYKASDIAQDLHLPLPTVSKLLKKLTQTKVVESVRGMHGGYKLARSAANISVQDVIQSLEGPIALTECSLASSQCEQLKVCQVQSNWQRINQAVHNALKDVSLADMAKDDLRLNMHIEQAPTGKKT